MLPPRCCLPCTHDFFFLPEWEIQEEGLSEEGSLLGTMLLQVISSASLLAKTSSGFLEFWGELRVRKLDDPTPTSLRGPPSSGSYLVLSKWLMSTSAPCLQEFQMLCKQCVLCISLIICLRYSGTKHQGPWYGLQLNSPYSGSWS